MLTRSAARNFSTQGLKVFNDVAKQQFIIKVKNDEAVLGYEQKGNNITFINTDVPPVFQGKGVGKILAKHAFDYALENKLDVTCQCSFLENFYKKNKNNYKSLKIEFDLEDKK